MVALPAKQPAGRLLWSCASCFAAAITDAVSARPSVAEYVQISTGFGSCYSPGDKVRLLLTARTRRATASRGRICALMNGTLSQTFGRHPLSVACIVYR